MVGSICDGLVHVRDRIGPVPRRSLETRSEAAVRDRDRTVTCAPKKTKTEAQFQVREPARLDWGGRWLRTQHKVALGLTARATRARVGAWPHSRRLHRGLAPRASTCIVVHLVGALAPPQDPPLLLCQVQALRALRAAWPVRVGGGVCRRKRPAGVGPRLAAVVQPWPRFVWGICLVARPLVRAHAAER